MMSLSRVKQKSHRGYISLRAARLTESEMTSFSRASYEKSLAALMRGMLSRVRSAWRA